MKTKYCPHCKIWKPISEFYKNKTQKDGLNDWCKICINKKIKLWQVKHIGYTNKILKN